MRGMHGVSRMHAPMTHCRCTAAASTIGTSISQLARHLCDGVVGRVQDLGAVAAADVHVAVAAGNGPHVGGGWVSDISVGIRGSVVGLERFVDQKGEQQEEERRDEEPQCRCSPVPPSDERCACVCVRTFMAQQGEVGAGSRFLAPFFL